MAAQPVSSSNATVMLIPSNGPRPSVIQGGQAFPGMVIQPAMPVQYVPYGGQEYRSATNQPHQKPYVGPLEKLLKVETKTLGVKCSVGMNIMSAITALTGICLYITEFVLSSVAYSYYNQYLLHPPASTSPPFGNLAAEATTKSDINPLM
ncbi:hypothetical protein JRQ81_000169 [Phrynocephalus forsythii]|uniref:Uncharacterized protein n=1 Tax=Phrynocephalus forsythii TaxID=171643 RepID=A0A9Q1B7U0_9SAUR|nr:hypothetical protein JRQ81_000169 [Phrynocephalus forsythii]